MFLRATWICWLVVLHLMLLLNLWLVIASRSLFCTYCFGRCSYELVAKLIPLLHSYGSSTRYFDRMLDFSIISPYYYEGGAILTICSTLVLFPWNDFLQHNPKCLDSRVNRHSHLCIFFSNLFQNAFLFFFFFFIFTNSIYCSD